MTLSTITSRAFCLLTSFTESLDLLAPTSTPARAWTLLDTTAATWTVTEEPGTSMPAVRKTTAGRTVMDISSSGVTNLYTYDGSGRQVAATGGQGSTRVTLYNSLNQIAATAAYLGNPADLQPQLLIPNSSLLTNITVFGYDHLGRQTSITDPLSNTVHTAYDAMGSVIAQWGGAYPVRYTYDPFGRMSTMRTFRDLPADEPPPAYGGDVTEWVYETGTGLIIRKRYHGGTAVNHTYTPDGRPLRTTWARGVWKQHHYDALGQLIQITYSDSTATHYTYDAAGNLTNATGSAGFVFDYIYDAASMLAGETITNGGVTNTLSRLYDVFRRPASIALTAGGVSAQGTAYAYDGAGLLSAVTATNTQGRVFRLEYTNSLGLALGYRAITPGGNVITRAVTRDPLRPHLVTGVTNLFNGSVVSAWTYRYDAAGRVVSRDSDTFGYNTRSELTSALLHTNAYGYVYDPIGNRLFSSCNAETNTYTANHLNQYAAINTATPQYDADGNMTSDGTNWHYLWNAENRVTCASNDNHVVRYAYDYQGRMVRKTISSASTQQEKQITYIWDGWNIIAERTVTDGTTNNVYNVWGLDLSGTLQGAGGVGGLLAVVRDDGTFFPCYDANGNVTEYVDESGAVRAHYEYSPFGEITAQSGDMADTFRFRFSTKYHDPETGHY